MHEFVDEEPCKERREQAELDSGKESESGEDLCCDL
jgi:hypothetical protein